jgi:3-isopropylmalate/(R)-2-methylmalate dehydratase small subunit
MLAIQAAAQADPAAVFEVDVANACLSQGEQSWALDLAAGPRQMLCTGQWDATGQLLANGKVLEAAAARLPYLSGFVAATR